MQDLNKKKYMHTNKGVIIKHIKKLYTIYLTVDGYFISCPHGDKDSIDIKKYIFNNLYNKKHFYLLEYIDVDETNIYLKFDDNFKYSNYRIANSLDFTIKESLLKKYLFNRDLLFNENCFIVSQIKKMYNEKTSIDSILFHEEYKHLNKDTQFYIGVIDEMQPSSFLINKKNNKDFLFLDYDSFGINPDKKIIFNSFDHNKVNIFI